MLVVVDSGSGNLRSVEKALVTAGGAPTVTSDPDVVRRATRVVLPGQGAFRDCTESLGRRGLDQAVREAIGRGTPYLGICLGLQILFDESEEHGPCRGLGVLRGRVVRFRPRESTLKVPHMGWNDVHPRRDAPPWRGTPAGTAFYFVHSYYVVPAESSVVALTAGYDGEFCAAAAHENVFATQFHPEKSSRAGLQLLRQFLEWNP